MSIVRVFSESNDAAIYCAADANILQGKTVDNRVLELGADCDRCGHCHNDRIIVRYDRLDLCSVLNARLLHAKYPVEESAQRHRHPSFASIALARTAGIVYVLAHLAVHGLFPDYTRTVNRKWNFWKFQALDFNFFG